MRITGVGGQPSIVPNKLQKNAGVSVLGAPNWAAIPHKGMARLSDEEMAQEIDALGKTLSECKTEKEFQAAYAKRAELEAQFISPVSPDRKGMVEKGQNALRGQLNQSPDQAPGKKPKDGILNIFDYITMAKEKYKRNEDGELYWGLGSGETMTAHEVCPSGYEVNFEENGARVMSYHKNPWDNGWYITPTKAELGLIQVFSQRLGQAMASHSGTAQAQNRPAQEHGLNTIA